MTYHPQNILITGGAGFIGSNFIHHILNQENPPKIINLDLLTYAGSLENLDNLPNENHSIFIKDDICNRRVVDQILREHSIDTIIHFAAESHVDRSISGPATFIQTNIIGTFTLLETARNYWLEEKKLGFNQCRFHHISTDEVFGSLGKDEPPFTEKSIYEPNSPYSAAKASSDHLVRAYFHTYNLPVTTTNCSNNYGPRQHLEKFIPTVIYACLQQKNIPVYGDGTNIRDWLYVEDHCRGIMRVVKMGKLGETYNIGGNNEWSNVAIAQKICEILDELHPSHQPYKNLIKFVTDRPGHDWRYAIDTTKIKNELDWKPLETFETGIYKTIQYYLNQFNENPT